MTDSPVVRARLDFSYAGTGFAGWAIQPQLRTVQGVMEDALAKVVRRTELLRFHIAGRTDAGVHARGQVAHVDIPRDAWLKLPGHRPRTPADALRDRLNGVLSNEIVIHSISEAPYGFDARFSATERRYAYRISDRRATRDPLTHKYVWWTQVPLSIDALSEASGTLLGLHDFAAFCRPRPGATTIRDLTEFSWARPTDGVETGLVVATVRADAFCHSMVRSLVGAVVAVGEGRRDLEWLASVASSRGRASAIMVAPAHGLTLEHVSYPSDEEVAARAEATRARRALD